jgi:hypothetical protein
MPHKLWHEGRDFLHCGRLQVSSSASWLPRKERRYKILHLTPSSLHGSISSIPQFLQYAGLLQQTLFNVAHGFQSGQLHVSLGVVLRVLG